MVGGFRRGRSSAAHRPVGGRRVWQAAGPQRIADKHWIDREIGYGVAAHEGALFGLANQILDTLTALFLVILSVSGAVMWWRRPPVGLLGAPIPISRVGFGAGLVAAIVALALYLPMFGITLAAVIMVERLVLSRMPAASRWLGLRRSSRTF